MKEGGPLRVIVQKRRDCRERKQIGGCQSEGAGGDHKTHEGGCPGDYFSTVVTTGAYTGQTPAKCTLEAVEFSRLYISFHKIHFNKGTDTNSSLARSLRPPVMVEMSMFKQKLTDQQQMKAGKSERESKRRHHRLQSCADTVATSLVWLFC